MAINVALAQYPITYHQSFETWQNHTASWVAQAVNLGGKLLVFPEYGSMELVSVFSPEIKADLKLQLEALQGLLSRFQETFIALAKQYDCVIVAPSFPVKIEDKFVNRAYVFSATGQGFQDKWFMTRFETESWGISSIDKQLTVFDINGCRFGIQICYDIEFPIGSHLLAKEKANLIVAPSCTETIRGATRVHVGARSRALEQQVFVGVSQTILEATWSPAVDLNYGFAAVYSSPDAGLPEEGILTQGETNVAKWIVQALDFSKNDFLQHSGQVFNRKDMAAVEMKLSETILIKTVKL